jgi:hypothetical protein
MSLPTPRWKGWSVDSFIFARTAPPVDVVGAIEFTESIALYPRPDVVPGVPLGLHGSQFPVGKAFNPAAFTPHPQGNRGDFGRNILRGFGVWPEATVRASTLSIRSAARARCSWL